MGLRVPYRAITLYPSAATGTGTDTGTGTTIVDIRSSEMHGYRAVLFELDVTAAATDAGDTLDVFVQCAFDETNWIDVVHFTQVLGNGGAKRYFAKVISDGALTEFEGGTALGAAAARNIMGRLWRARWEVTDADNDGGFTFSVTMIPM